MIKLYYLKLNYRQLSDWWYELVKVAWLLLIFVPLNYITAHVKGSQDLQPQEDIQYQRPSFPLTASTPSRRAPIITCTTRSSFLGTSFKPISTPWTTYLTPRNIRSVRSGASNRPAATTVHSKGRRYPAQGSHDQKCGVLCDLCGLTGQELGKNQRQCL